MSPDTIVPGAANPQAWNRYSYVLGNPLKYVDPTGHGQCQTQEDCDDMGTTPMGTGGSSGNSSGGNTGGGNGGGNPHDDDDVDPNPQGLPGLPECYPGELVCQLAAGGYELTGAPPQILPDYYIGSLFVAYPLFPIFGVNFAGILDKYGNGYFNFGGGLTFIGNSLNGGGGWFLGPDNNTEQFAETFLQGHSFNVSGGPNLGVGINNNYPSYIQVDNEGAKLENISVEALYTSPGITAVFSYSWLIYDKGDNTPWIWQGD